MGKDDALGWARSMLSHVAYETNYHDPEISNLGTRRRRSFGHRRSGRAHHVCIHREPIYRCNRALQHERFRDGYGDAG
jgi:hypothetical protein